MARVLIIEDEPTIAMVLREALSDEGYETAVASDGLSGLAALQAKPSPDIVLVDLFMPGVTGRAVVESMRAGGPLQEIPVVLVTGAVPSAEDFPPPGSYQAILAKPFELTDLLQTIDNLLASA